MCNNRDCQGDQNAPSKWACKACHGVKYTDPEELKQDFAEQKRYERVNDACVKMHRALKDIEKEAPGTVDLEAVCRAIGAGVGSMAGNIFMNLIKKR